MDNKEKYRSYCKKHGVALYQNDWWMDAVCGNNWDTVVTGNSAFAFPFKKKYGLKLMQMPMLTLGLGSASEEIIKQLPDFDLLDLYFLPNEKAEAAEWKGFKKNIRYSYHLNDISNTEKVFENFNPSTRQQIRKGQKNVTVSESSDVAMLYKMISLTFSRQKKKNTV